MAVTESKGDGFSLYGGYLFASPPVIDMSVYPYLVMRNEFLGGITLYAMGANSYYFTSNETIYFGGTSENPVPCLKFLYDEGIDAWGESALLSNFNIGAQINAGLGTTLWFGFDFVYEGVQYHTASAPISLDGMNVIEWDGDTMGLTILGDTHARVADYSNATNAVAVISVNGTLSTFTDFSANYDFFEWVVDSSSLVAFGYNGTLADSEASGIEEHGIYATSYKSSAYNVYTSLIAYTASIPTFDKKAFLSGSAMGLCGKGNPTFEGSDTFSKGYLAGAKLRAKRVIPAYK